MIYIKLWLAFLKIGLFSFGGAYGAIVLIQDAVTENHWADSEMFANLVALGETTPGPVMVNMATYIGSRQAGIGGALAATIGVVLPSFVIILLVAVLFRGCLRRRSVQAILMGVKPCLMGVILATGVWMAVSVCAEESLACVDWMACAIFLLLTGIVILYRRLRKREFPPAMLILLAAACGFALY